jgi:hypothetical protein
VRQQNAKLIPSSANFDRMPPETYRAFGGGPTETVLNPLALAILVIAVLLMWRLPRKYVIVPFLLTAILVPLEQQIVIAGLHLMILRLVLLCAWFRVLADLRRGDRLLSTGLVALDKVFMAWVVMGIITYTLLWSDSGAFINRMGFLYNAFGIYFLLRHLVRDHEDVVRLVRVLALLCFVLAVLMTIEQITGRNLLSIFGMPAEVEVRAGRIRSQASFAHSIIAGTCGAILVPAFIALWSIRKSRAYAVIGLIGATAMTVTSASSTPVAAYAAGLLALAFWPVRRYMALVRWAVLGMIVCLHLVMKAPVWALIGRIDLAGGSTSWHRFALVDSFVRRFGEWWLIGTRNNPNWGYDMWDSINWYVSSGITGGLLGLVLFVGILVVAFRTLGGVLKRSDLRRGPKQFAWCLGSSLFAAMVAFLGISFFDQSIVIWYALLSMTIAMGAKLHSVEAEPVPSLQSGVIALSDSQPIGSLS